MALIEENDEEIYESHSNAQPSYHTDIEKRIKEWVDNEGYITQGITLNGLSIKLCTNRTYLSEYINTTYQSNFRDWITNMRIEYAKRLMRQHQDYKLQDISEASGFMSVSHFTRTFREKEGCPPSRWLAGGSKCSAPSGPGMDGAKPEGAE